MLPFCITAQKQDLGSRGGKFSTCSSCLTGGKLLNPIEHSVQRVDFNIYIFRALYHFLRRDGRCKSVPRAV